MIFYDIKVMLIFLGYKKWQRRSVDLNYFPGLSSTDSTQFCYSCCIVNKTFKETIIYFVNYFNKNCDYGKIKKKIYIYIYK